MARAGEAKRTGEAGERGNPRPGKSRLERQCEIDADARAERGGQPERPALALVQRGASKRAQARGHGEEPCVRRPAPFHRKSFRHRLPEADKSRRNAGPDTSQAQ